MSWGRRTLHRHAPSHDPDEGGHGDSGAERWMVSYADFITVLMALFLVLYALSEANATKFAEMAKGLRAGFYGAGATEPNQPGASSVTVFVTSIGLSGGTAPEPLDHAGSYDGRDGAPALERVLPARENPPEPPGPKGGTAPAVPDPPTDNDVLRGFQRTLSGIRVGGTELGMFLDERGLVISIVGRVLFDAGSDTLKPDAKEHLGPLVEKLRSFDRAILIEGYPGAGETPAGMQPTSLSSRRAAGIVDYLASQQFPATRMVVVGYGEISSDPVGRVDVIVLSKKEQ